MQPSPCSASPSSMQPSPCSFLHAVFLHAAHHLPPCSPSMQLLPCSPPCTLLHSAPPCSFSLAASSMQLAPCCLIPLRSARLVLGVQGMRLTGDKNAVLLPLAADGPALVHLWRRILPSCPRASPCASSTSVSHRPAFFFSSRPLQVWAHRWGREEFPGGAQAADSLCRTARAVLPVEKAPHPPAGLRGLRPWPCLLCMLLLRALGAPFGPMCSGCLLR